MDSDDQARERLVAVARDMFARHGYEAVSVRDIARSVPLTDLGSYFVAAIVHRYRRGEPEPWLQMMRYIETASGADAPRYVFARRIDASLTRRLGENVDGRRRTRILVSLLIGLAEALRTAGMLDGASNASFGEFVDSYTRLAQDLVTPPT